MVTDYRSSNTPEDIRDLWQTPKWLFDFFNTRFEFSCDIASSDKNHLLEKYITEEMDSLTYDFSEFRNTYTWCNPPYSDITPWVDLAIKNKKLKVGTVLLLPADTSVKWFTKCINHADEIVFITGGRVSFTRADTQQSVSGNTKGSVVVIFSTEAERRKLSTSYIERDWIK